MRVQWAFWGSPISTCWEFSGVHKGSTHDKCLSLQDALLAQAKTLKALATGWPCKGPTDWKEARSWAACLARGQISYLPMEVPKSQSQASGATESAGKASASISFNPEIQAGTSPLMNALVCLAILNRSPSYVNKRRQTLKTGPLCPLYICITFSIFNALISWDLVMLKEHPLPGLTNSER